MYRIVLVQTYQDLGAHIMSPGLDLSLTLSSPFFMLAPLFGRNFLCGAKMDAMASAL